MIVLMAGLPGSGKSTLAREIAARTSGIVLSKDEIRHAIFAPDDVEYSTEQDDFCMKLLYQAAAFLLQRNPQRVVIVDGRPFAKQAQIEQAVQFAEGLSQPWHLLECECSDERALERLSSANEHPAANRDFELYLDVKKRWEEIPLPKTVINTGRNLDTCVREAMQALGYNR